MECVSQSEKIIIFEKSIFEKSKIEKSKNRKSKNRKSTYRKYESESESEREREEGGVCIPLRENNDFRKIENRKRERSKSEILKI